MINFITDLSTILSFSDFYSFSLQGNYGLLRLLIAKLRNKRLKNISSPFSKKHKSRICNIQFLKKGIISMQKKNQTQTTKTKKKKKSKTNVEYENKIK